MKITLKPQAKDDLLFFKRHDRQILERIKLLLLEIEKNHYQGVGKPEPLKYELAGFWSRRITREHRIVYQVLEDNIEIIQCRYHY